MSLGPGDTGAKFRGIVILEKNRFKMVLFLKCFDLSGSDSIVLLCQLEDIFVSITLSKRSWSLLQVYDPAQLHVRSTEQTVNDEERAFLNSSLTMKFTLSKHSVAYWPFVHKNDSTSSWFSFLQNPKKYLILTDLKSSKPPLIDIVIIDLSMFAKVAIQEISW